MDVRADEKCSVLDRKTMTGLISRRPDRLVSAANRVGLPEANITVDYFSTRLTKKSPKVPIKRILWRDGERQNTETELKKKSRQVCLLRSLQGQTSPQSDSIRACQQAQDTVFGPFFMKQIIKQERHRGPDRDPKKKAENVYERAPCVVTRTPRTLEKIGKCLCPFYEPSLLEFIYRVTSITCSFSVQRNIASKQKQNPSKCLALFRFISKPRFFFAQFYKIRTINTYVLVNNSVENDNIA